MRRVSFLMVLAIAALMSLGTSGALANTEDGGPTPTPLPAPAPVEVCPDGKKCEPTPIPAPRQGPCARADLVLLEDLLRNTGGLVCLYLGDNSPNASGDRDCRRALLALPIDNLLGACVYLPPVRVRRRPRASDVSSATADSAATSALSGLLNLGR